MALVKDTGQLNSRVDEKMMTLSSDLSHQLCTVNVVMENGAL